MTTLDRGYVRGFPRWSVDRQTDMLRQAGLPSKRIYVEGNGAESLATLQPRKGEVWGVAGGLRVLGASKRDITAAVRRFEDVGAVIFDVDTSQRSDRHGASMFSVALGRIHGERTMRDQDPAELGRAGAKSRYSRVKRVGLNEARKAWFDKSISIPEACEKTGWSKTKMFNEFGASGRPPGSFRTKDK